MNLRLDGKVCLVIGASRGIGRAIALALAAEHAVVGLVGRDAAGLAQTLQAIETAGGRGAAWPFDARASSEDWQALRQRCEAELGAADVLVYGAAAPDRPARFASISAEHWQEVMATDLEGFWQCASAFLPGMGQRGWGRVMALGSLMGKQGGFSEGAYAAAKAGLGGLIKTIALEYGARGVTANLVVPGRIATERTSGLSERAAEAMRRVIPARREGRPEEVAAVVAFLASELASYVNGAELPVTGGRELGMVAL